MKSGSVQISMNIRKTVLKRFLPCLVVLPFPGLASQYGVFVTPTHVFLDANRVEMAEKLVGIWFADYYGGFIDNSIYETREKF